MANLKGKLYEHLKERGLIYQTTNEEDIKKLKDFASKLGLVVLEDYCI